VNEINVWFSNNLWVLAGLLIPFVWGLVKARFPAVGVWLGGLLSLFKKTPTETEEEVILDLLKRLSVAKGEVPPVADPLEAKAEVIQSLGERIKALLAEKTKQIEDKLAGLKKAV
jgi:hypothetical protein